MSMKNGKLTNIMILVTGLLCMAGLGWGQTQTPEAPGIWKNAPQKIAVNEELSYIYQQDTASEITVIHLLFRGGLRAVPVAERGLAFLASRLAVEVTSNDDLRELMHLGSTIHSNVDGDFITITIDTLSENLEPTLKLLAKTIRKPLFSGLRIDNLKRYMAHREKNEQDVPERLMELAFLKAFSGKSDYGYNGSIFGDAESRKQIKRKNVSAFHNLYFNSANTVLTVTTDLSKDKITEVLNTYFSAFPAGKAVPLPQVTLAVPKQKAINITKENEQVLIAFGVMLPGFDAGNSSNYVRIFMLENLLGRGIGSRLWPLRSRKDLAYSVNSRFLQMQAGGLLMVYMKSDKDKRETAYKALKKVLMDFYSGGVDDEELTITKVLSRAEFLRNNETKDQRAAAMAYFEAMGPGFGFIEGFVKEIENTTREQLNMYMKQVMNPTQMVEVIIGPEK